ncbi:ABC transporter ATP-binding protein [Pseudonocardia ailaonensis]|uniref:ABC transporter ATP-binding protein n=1 Tax=Pseudonocardia ailaonensis TaxID=367279 RepID=A0ABN2MUR1_9PSEU
MTRGDALLDVRDLAVRFPTRNGPIVAVREVSLTLRAGECLAIVGESGSGKSVTARSLLGLAGPTATIEATGMTFEGQHLLSLGEREWRRLRGARIGFVLQDALTSLDPLRRIEDEVAEPLDLHADLGRRERAERVRSLLSDVGIPDPEVRARQYPHELSGGLRQRALIASAIAAGPSLVVADEPTTALDVTIQAQVLDLLAAQRDAGTAILLISHDLTVVARMADHVAVMYAGVVVEEGPAEAILQDPVHPYTRALLAAAPTIGARRPVPVSVGRLAPPATGPGCHYRSRCSLADVRCEEELPPLRREGGGPVLARCWHADTHEIAPEAATAVAAPATSRARVLEVQGVSKRFRLARGRRLQAVDDVSFTVRAGEALGVVGESGSGKSTVARIALGMLAPDGGRVLLDGEAWSELRERERRPHRSRIQIVHQDPLSSFDPRFSVERIVGEALGRPGPRGAAANRSRIVELLHRVGLDASLLDRRGTQLSGGQRQRVAIARALGPDPDVLVCDEPVSALDVSVQAQILDLFDTLRRDLGTALLFISHDLGVIHRMCERVLVMKDGAIVEEGPVGAVLSTPRHPYTRELLAAVSPAPSPGRTIVHSGPGPAPEG